MLLLEEPSSSKYWSVYFQYLQFELRLKLIFLRGVVLSNKMARTVILRRDYLHYIKKYNRFEKRHHNLPAHLSPAFSRTRIGDIVTVGQCKKLSKTVLFNVIRVEKKRVEGNVRKTFCMF
jgi:small subunit ribosomal protein S11e